MDLRQKIEDKTPNIKRNCDLFVNSIPSPKGKAACEKHGEFEFKYQEGFGNKYLCMSCCASCVSERDDFINLEIKRIQLEEKESLTQDKIIRSGVSKRNLLKTFDSYHAATPEQAKAKASFKEFADSVCNGLTTSNLIACGSVGVGKTHLASSATNQIVRKGKDCRVIKIIDLIRQFKDTWDKSNDATEKGFLDHYTKIPALIIDEVGVQFGSDTEKMIVFDIIDGRYNNMLPTVLISNLAIDGVKELIGDRAIDRMREDGGNVVAMKWDSYRGKS